MKKLKALIAIALLTVMSLTVLSFAACGGEKEPPPPEGKVCYTYEAEDVDLTGLSGPVYSGEASEWKMVCGENTSYIKNNYPKVLESISNGYFISYFNGKGTILNFIFTSNKACTGNELRIRLASEWGTLKIDPDNIIVRINDEKLNFDPFTVSGEKLSDDGALGQYKTPFKDYVLTKDFAIKEGENLIEIEVGDGQYGLFAENYTKYGPGVDCIKMYTDSDVKLEWEKLLEEHMDGVKPN